MNIITEKIKVSLITITRAEGKSILCGKPRVFKTWEDAKYGMLLYNSTYPPAGQGYDKHDFKVIFEDGETYSGRLDVKQITCQDNDQDPRQHVRDTVKFYTGNFKPGWMKPEQYEQALLGVNSQEYIDWLQKYDV